MYTALIVSILVLSIFVIPFVFGFEIETDIFGNIGSLKAKVFSITVFKAKVKIESRSAVEKVIVITNGKKTDEIHLNADKNDKQSVVALLRTAPIMSYIRMARLTVAFNIGFAQNAFNTTMSVAFLRILFSAISAFLKSRQNIAVSCLANPYYNCNRLDFSLNGIFKLSLANIINSLTAGILNKLGIYPRRGGKKPIKKFVIKKRGVKYDSSTTRTSD